MPWLASASLLLTSCKDAEKPRYEATPEKPKLGYVNPRYLDDIEIDQDTTTLRIDETALLVIDVQPEYCDPRKERGNDETDHIAHVIDSLAPIFRKAGMTPINVFMNKDKNAEEIQFYRYRPDKGDTFIAKKTDSPFQSSAIDDTLQVHKKQKLLLMGFNLVACVMHTALDAKFYGYDVYVVIDATGNDNKNLSAGENVDKNLRYMQQEGIHFIRSGDAINRLK